MGCTSQIGVLPYLAEEDGVPGVPIHERSRSRMGLCNLKKESEQRTHLVSKTPSGEVSSGPPADFAANSNAK